MSSGEILPIYEHFFTWQGEGTHQGRSAYFIRTFGCPVHCPWCDSAGTWHKDYIPSDIEKLSISELLSVAESHNPDFVVVTGGEPTIHNLNPLTQICYDKSLPVHLETSGAFEIKGNFDWITLSPKQWKKPLKENIALANEIKIIVDSETAIQDWIDSYPEILKTESVWLNPEWSKRNDPIILDIITETVKQNGAPFRAGYQLHKLYHADQKDANSRPNVPLGGNINRGL